MSVVFLSLLLIFELIQQVTLINFMLHLNICKILKISFWTFWRKNCISLALWALFSLKPYKVFSNSTVQTAATSVAMIKFWSKFNIQILCYSFTWDNRFLLTPFQSFPGKQENPSSSASKHINHILSLYPFLDSEL